MTAVRSTRRPIVRRRVATLLSVLTLVGAVVVGTDVAPASAGTVTVALGFNVIASGQSTVVKGTMSPAAAGSRVAVERRLPSGTWSTRAVGTGDATGEFKVPIKPTGIGIYALRVRTTAGYSPIIHLRVLAPLSLDPGGMGPLRLGMTLAQAMATHWVRGTTEGCEFAGPGQRAAVFPPAIKAIAAFESGKLTFINLREGGSTVQGLLVGAPSRTLETVYPAPTYRVVERPEVAENFGVRLFEVRRGTVKLYEAIVDPDTNRITDLGVPQIPFCD